MKKVLLTAALALSAFVPASSASAQTGGGTNLVCSLTGVFVGFNATNCVGFFSGNALSGNSGDITIQNNAVNSLLGTVGTNYYATQIQKYDVPNNTAVDFTQLLYGTTAIGFHFGNSAFPADYNGNGGGTAFFRFEAPTTGPGINIFQLASKWTAASSGATLYRTGSCLNSCGPVITSVPEPSTYALMTTGLVGIFGFARRRRSHA